MKEPATGGGIESDAGSSAIITNCTITGNTAGNGGGIYGYASSSTITNCTISGNTATSGGGICLDNASASVTNSILWGNVPDQHYLTNNGRFSSLTYSDIDNDLGDTGNTEISARTPCLLIQQTATFGYSRPLPASMRERVMVHHQPTGTVFPVMIILRRQIPEEARIRTMTWGRMRSRVP